MRVMFVALPQIGHAFPMMPLARHLAASGHEVLMATGGDAVTVLAKLDDPNFRVTTCWPPSRLNFTPSAARGLALHPRLALRGAAGMADAEAAGRVFAVVNRPAVPALIAQVREFRPDIIIHDPYAAAAAIAAERADVPSVLHNIALNDGAALLAQIRRHLVPFGSRPATQVLSIAPPSVSPIPGTPMRYVPFSIPEVGGPEWLYEKADRPRIIVTRSTSLGDGPNAMLSSVLAAAPEVDAEIVIVRPNRPMQRLKRLPPNIRMADWIPLHAVLHTCAALVNHGGAGSVFVALRAGIPQIVTPAPGDRAWNATRVAKRGAGLSVPPRRITAEHLHALINDRVLADNAAQVAAEIAAMPSVEMVAAELVSATA